MKIIKILTFVALILPAFADKPEAPETFVELFNGKDLTGWKGEGYIVENGSIASTPAARNLRTEGTYSNYILEFDFQLTPGANNGLGIHYTGEGDPAYNGMEIQILDSTAEKYKELKPYQHHGSLYTLLPAKQGALKPLGEWNTQRVVVNGAEITVIVNGVTVLTADLDKLNAQYPKHLGAKRREGHITFCGHGDRVLFRKIRLAALPAAQ